MRAIHHPVFDRASGLRPRARRSRRPVDACSERRRATIGTNRPPGHPCLVRAIRMIAVSAFGRSGCRVMPRCGSRGGPLLAVCSYTGRRPSVFVAILQHEFGKDAAGKRRMLRAGSGSIVLSGSHWRPLFIRAARGAGGPEFGGRLPSRNGNPGSSNLDWRSKMKLKSLLSAPRQSWPPAPGRRPPTFRPLSRSNTCGSAMLSIRASTTYRERTPASGSAAVCVVERTMSTATKVGARPRHSADRRTSMSWTTRAAACRIDARTQTDMGLIRALRPADDARTWHEQRVRRPHLRRRSDLVAAFIQISNDWGTITAGHSGSFFNDWGSNTFGTRIGIDDPTTEQTLFGYTYAGGGGFSASISIEDYSSAGRRRDYGGDPQAGGFGQCRSGMAGPGRQRRLLGRLGQLHRDGCVAPHPREGHSAERRG